MSQIAKVCHLLILFSCCARICSTFDDMRYFKCFDNGQGRIPGLAALMPGGQVTSFPDAHGISAVQCSSLCLERNDTCFSYAYHEERCFLRNISLAHPGMLCGISVLEGRLRCPAERIGDIFVAFSGANSTMLECMCGVQNANPLPWNYLPGVSHNDCADNCRSLPCSMKLGLGMFCWVCHGDYQYCNPYKDPYPTTPQRVVCMPILLD